MEGFVRLRDVMGCLYDTLESYYIKRNIMNLPTYDVNPVVRGKWIDEGTFADNNNAHAYMCSNCCSHVIEYPEEIKDQHFCYNCGADMREAEE